MKDAPDRLPKRSYELIELLASTVAEPSWPATARTAAELDPSKVRTGLFLAGARALVAQLVAQMEEEICDDEAAPEGVSDGPWAQWSPVLDPHGGIREVTSPARMVEDRA